MLGQCWANVGSAPDSRPTLGQRWHFTLGQHWQHTLGQRHFARWPYVGPTLPNYNPTLANYNPMLGQHWFCVGPTLAQCWANVSFLCAVCGFFWANVGPKLSQHKLNMCMWFLYSANVGLTNIFFSLVFRSYTFNCYIVHWSSTLVF